MIKKSFFLFFCTMLTLNVKAQDLGLYNYSIGAKGYSLLQMPKLMNEIKTDEYNSVYANTVFVKLLDNQINYRIIGSYNSEDIRFKNQCSTCQEGEGNRIDYSFKLGFEKNITYSKIQPYYGIDLGYRANKFSGTIRDLTISTPLYSVESDKVGASLSPFLGVKINISPNILLFGEGNFEFFYSYENRETVNNAPGSPTSFSRYTRMEYLLNPVSAGLQINFGSRN